VIDYRAWIMHVNRLDFLFKAVNSAADIKDGLTVIDNSAKEDERLAYNLGVKVFRPCVPLSCPQSFNLMMRETREAGTNICIWMHSDAEAHAGSCLKLLNTARKMNDEGRKWGILWTNYDALCAMNANMLQDVGEWDINLPQYFVDNDQQRRLRIAGYELIDTGIPVHHTGSVTIRSDKRLEFLNSITFPLYEKYYRQKWGGSPGQETFTIPFGRSDIFG
jgi:hypothetical protein